MKGLETRLDIPVDVVLEGAREARYKQVVVLAEGEDGRLYVHASAGSYAYSLMLMELGKRRLLERLEEET